MKLSDEQLAPIEEMKKGGSQVILVRGFSGSGKSVITRELQGYFPNALVGCYSGIAANNIGGQTVSSMFGIPTQFVINPKFMDAKNVRKKDIYAKHFNRPDKNSDNPWEPRKYAILRLGSILILDEIYSLRCDHVDFIDKTLRQVFRKPDVAFGGMRVFMSGDEGQAGPIAKRQDEIKLREYGYLPPFDFREAWIFKGDNQGELEL